MRTIRSVYITVIDKLGAQKESLGADITVKGKLIVSDFMSLFGRWVRKSLLANRALKGPGSIVGVHM